MIEQLDAKADREMAPNQQPGRRMGAVASHNALYHEGSTNPGGAKGIFGENYYDRGVDEYLEALNNLLSVEDLRGKVVIDIGSGKNSAFGRELSAMGAQVLSVNPTLKNEAARATLQGSIDKKYQSDLFWHREASSPQTRMQRWFGLNKPEPLPERELPNSVAALGQELPVLSESADVVVSVFGVPQYLHHLDPGLAGNDEEILRAYTDDIRAQDKELITVSFKEVLRVLKPGGKAYFADTHRTPGQTKNINPYSPGDGTEVIEVLESFGDRISYQIEEAPLPDGSTRRVIAFTKQSSLVSGD